MMLYIEVEPREIGRDYQVQFEHKLVSRCFVLMIFLLRSMRSRMANGSIWDHSACNVAPNW
jgi:hypothetical protein